MKTSQRGIDLIKSSEGLRLKAYPDPGTGAEPWTIGYGTTTGVYKGMVISSADAEALLQADLRHLEPSIEKLLKVKVTQGQFDALVSFSYNVGEGDLAKSTLLKKVNQGDFKGAAEEFGKWVYAAKKVLPGLVTRRAAERALFESK